jgi:tRNA(Leu) C34 or U34 (ribose-2'-O)-methylase TrmL
MQPLDRFVVVLDRPQDPINVGAVVRAVKNMGLSRLRLVRPAPFEREELLRIAHHSEDLLDRIEVFDYLDDALADATYVVGTAAVRHSGHTQTQDVRGLATRLMERPAEETIALLFGTEGRRAGSLCAGSLPPGGDLADRRRVSGAQSGAVGAAVSLRSVGQGQQLARTHNADLRAIFGLIHIVR